MDSDHPINDLLRSFDPSDSALLDWIKPHLDDNNLWRMASDGTPDQENYFHALKRIQQGEPIPVPLFWVPLEILNLNRWREPDGYELPNGLKHCDLTSSPERTREHLERAFCCAVLLKAADEPETRGNIFGENDAMIQLLASVLYLGQEASRNMLRLLCWRVLRMPEGYEDLPFFAMAVLLLHASLCARSRQRRPHPTVRMGDGGRGAGAGGSSRVVLL